jgi:hypothetical protein
LNANEPIISVSYISFCYQQMELLKLCDAAAAAADDDLCSLLDLFFES